MFRAHWSSCGFLFTLWLCLVLPHLSVAGSVAVVRAQQQLQQQQHHHHDHDHDHNKNPKVAAKQTGKGYPTRTTTTTTSASLLRQFHEAWNDFWHLKNFLAPLKLHGRGDRPCLPATSPSSQHRHHHHHDSSSNDDSDALPAVLQVQRRGRSKPHHDEYSSNGAAALEIFQPEYWMVCQRMEEHDLASSSSGGSSSRTQAQYDPHIGMVLEVYNLLQGRICTVSGDNDYVNNNNEDMSIEVAYQLQEPLHLELGTTVKHAADFAYVPVITAGTESIRITEDSFLDYTATMAEQQKGDNDESLEGRPQWEWWQWWIPWWKWDGSQDHSQQYRMRSSFAGGSHGEVWRGRRQCHGRRRGSSLKCRESLIFKRLKIENGYRVLEAGLREIYFGTLVASSFDLFTEYVDHFFRERKDMEPELWIVFRDAGPSLRSFIYLGTMVGDFILYQHSPLWAQLRRSVSQSHQPEASQEDCANSTYSNDDILPLGRDLFRRVLRQILESAAFLHEKGIVHRDIKPSNIMCHSSLGPEDEPISTLDTSVRCVLGDFSSAWNKFTDENLFTGGPSRAEQTDEYAPPESLFDAESPWLLSPAFDSWSIGIVALELLLGTPNVFTVDQRTKAILTHKLKHQGATDEEIERALYLAALSQFCIYNPHHISDFDWPLRVGDPLHKSAMVKETCTLHDFHRALRARDPLGIGFDEQADQLLLLVWQLLAWDPNKRISAREALRHPYFEDEDEPHVYHDNDKALESLMLDPRRDFNLTDVIDEFTCPRCGRVFGDWKSCRMHAIARKHAKFCRYDHTSLPTCLNAHAMLPAHVASGHCDIQGRRRVIEDMHAVYLTSTEHFYGIFDGHSGNRASKYAASFLFAAMKERLALFLSQDPSSVNAAWSKEITLQVEGAFHDVHDKFLDAIALIPQSRNDQSGTTATVAFVTKDFVVLASLGDSRAVLSTKKAGVIGAVQLTRDHAASDPLEKAAVEKRGGKVINITGVHRVNGTLAITRSLGDSRLSGLLSQTPDVMSFTRDAALEMCGELKYNEFPCFLVLASDGLWDVVSNDEAIDLVVDTIEGRNIHESHSSNHTALQRAAEALVHEAFVRGSSDNIGVCVIAMSEWFGE